MADCPQDDRLHVGPEADQAVDVVRCAQGRVDRHRRPDGDVGREEAFHSLVQNRSEVLEARIARPIGRGEQPLDQRIGGLLVVVGELHVRSPLEDVAVEARLELRRALRLERVVAHRGDDQPRHVGAVHRSDDPLIVPRRVQRSGLHAGGPVRRAQPQRGEPARRREEGLLRNDPGALDLRVVHRLERAAEGAVVVGAETSREKPPILPAEHFLHVAAQRDGFKGRFAVGLAGSVAGLPPARWEDLAEGEVAEGQVLQVLHTHRRPRRDLGRHVAHRGDPRIHRVVGELEPVVAAPALAKVAEARPLVERLELNVHPVGVIDPDRGATSERRRRPPVTLDAAGEARDVLLRAGREHVSRQEETPLPRLRRPGGQRCEGLLIASRPTLAEQPAPQDAGDVVVVLRQSRVALDQARRERYVGLAREDGLQIRPCAHAPAGVRPVLVVGERVDVALSGEAGVFGPGHAQHADVVAVFAGQVVPGLIAATRQLHAHAPPIARPVGRRGGIAEHVELCQAVDGTRRLAADRRRQQTLRDPLLRRKRVRQQMAPAVEVVRIGVMVAEEPEFRVHGPLRRPRHPLTSGDPHDAVTGLCAVKRRGSRPFHDLDGLNVLGIQVVDARGRLSAQVDRQRGRVVPARFDLGAVDVIRRLVAERHARDPADPDPDSRAHRAAGLEHLDVGRPARKEVREVGRLRLLDDVLGVDLGHGVGELATGLLPRGRHGHDVEGDRGWWEAEVERRRGALRDIDGLGLHCVTDRRHAHEVTARRNGGQRIPPLSVGRGGPGRVQHEHLGAGQARTRRLVRHASRDRPCALLRRAPADGAEQQRGQGDRADVSSTRMAGGRVITHRCPPKRAHLRRGSAAVRSHSLCMDCSRTCRPTAGRASTRGDG